MATETTARETQAGPPARTPAATEDAAGSPPPRSSSLWGRLSRNKLALFGAVLVALIALLALAAPILPLADPNVTEPADRLLPPLSEGAWLGTDQLGRDLLSRLIWGTRVSLAVGLAATAIAALVGSAVGLIAAYFGKLTDQVLMRLIDVLMAFPYLLLALAIVAALGPGLFNALLAISIVNVPFFARSVRGATLGLVNREFVEAARVAGYSDTRIVLSELLPNVMPVVVIACSTTVGWMILETAGLSFLGLGAQPPTADLGSMLGDGRQLLLNAPHVAVVPGVAILVLVIGINLLGDGLRDALDPRLTSGVLSRPVPRTDTAPAAERTEGLPARPAEGDAPLLSVRDLSTSFFVGGETYRAVNGVSFDLKAGESLGVVGESGSGKSVTAMSLLGLVPTPPGKITGGEALFKGRDLLGVSLRDLQDLRGDRIAFVFQDPLSTLNPLLPVGEQVAESLRRHQGLSHRAARKGAVDLLARTGLADAGEKARAYPHQLSGGQRQRAVIAMALANRPDVIVADEPTTALDVTTQARVLELMNELRRTSGAALLFITHDLGVVAELCERVLVMYAGRVVEAGPAAEVFGQPRHPYTQALLDCVPVLGQPERARDAIPGLPPPVNRLPKGCAFAPRCPLAVEKCRQSEISLVPVGAAHKARCVRTDETARG